MNAWIKLLSIVVLILGAGLCVQKWRDVRPAAEKEASLPTRTQWSEKDLKARKALSQESQIPESLITLEDISFKRDFPNFYLVKKKPYSILTEQKSFGFQNALQTLFNFENDFRRFFGGLIFRKSGKPLQVVFFDSQKTFNQFKNKIGAPSWSGGFYNFENHRLYLFNAMDISKTASPLSYAKIPLKYQELLIPTLSGQMDQTLSVMRHEASHQLFVEYGIIPEDAAAWLHEGLAVYSEKPQIGLPHRQYLTLLPFAPKIKIRELMQPFRFGGLDGEQAMAAYVMSWAAVSYLMRQERQPGFYKYLFQIRKNPALSQRPESLAKALGKTPDQMESEFEAFLKAQSGRNL
jgi:hypothetical protein